MSSRLVCKTFLMRSVWAAGLCAGLALAAAARVAHAEDASAAHPSLRIELVEASGGDGRLAVSVSGFSEADASWLEAASGRDGGLADVVTVRIGREADPTLPAVAGSHRLAAGGSAVVFEPRFGLKAGTAYTVEVRRPSAGGGAWEVAARRVVTAPRREAGRPTRVTAVYPSLGVLPANHLRFYIEFSGPMSRGEAYERVHLLREDGRAVEQAFLELGEELWDPEGRRLTLLFHPGRVKRGLQPREELGPILEEGGRYELVIDAAWRDAAGRPLAAAHRKSFRVGPADYEQPDVRRWAVRPPTVGTRRELIVELDEPLDRAMLERVLTVAGPDGRRRAGRVTVDRGERRWRFQPERPWAPGRHRLWVATALEDPAGNSIGRRFEAGGDQGGDDSAAPPEFVHIQFEPREESAP